MRWCRISLRVLIAVLSGISVWPGPTAMSPPRSHLPGRAQAPSLDVLYQRGQDHLYNLDYEEALEAFDRALDAAPDHPGPYAWKAVALWMREMFDRGEFDLRGYLDVSRFKGEEDEEEVERGEAERSRLTRRVLGLIDDGLQRARAWSDDPERTTDGLYYRGLLLGTRAGYRTLVLRDFLDAIGDTRESVKLHRRVVAADPSFIDPYYSLGTYNYVAGKLPWYVKLFSFFVGIRGDAEKGRRQLERVAEAGDRLREAARVTLTVIYVREDQPRRSAELLEGLVERFPRNYLFAQNRAFALGLAGDWGVAADVYARLLRQVNAGVPNYQLADPVRLGLDWGQAALEAGRAEMALRAYRGVLLEDDAPARARTLAHLGRGQAHDLAGDRQAALDQYRAVLHGPDVADAHARAEEYLEEPYDGRAPAGGGNRRIPLREVGSAGSCHLSATRISPTLSSTFTSWVPGPRSQKTSVPPRMPETSCLPSG